MATDPSTFNTTATLSKVSASWTSSGADGYRIYRKTGTGAFVKIVETNASTFTHVDIVANYDSAGNEYTYQYKLTAFDNTGESTGLTNTVNMPTITSSDVNSTSVLDTQLSTGNVSNTYSNTTTTAAIDVHTETAHDGRQGAQGVYDDRL
jgi:hypothetical protein